MESQGSKREKTLFSFFKPRESASTSEGHSPSNVDISNHQPPLSKSRRVEIDLSTLERDPGIRIPIWQHPVNQRDEIRRAYIKMGPYQPKLAEYRRTKSGSQNRKFQYSWFECFPWLEYSPSKDAAFCFPCFVFQNKVPLHPAFITEGFNSWKRVNDGVRCAFLMHVGGPTSPHRTAVKCVEDLMKVTGHIDKVLNAQTVEEVQKNRLRLTATIESIKWLSLQACAFRGHDESQTSSNRGNFIEMIRLMGRLNVNIGDVVLDKDSMTVCQHYHFDVFNSAIDFQHEELNSKFSDGAVELLILSSALEPKDNFKSFKVDDICKLAEKFYPEDFSEQEMHYLRCQLNHYKIDVLHHKSFQNMSTMTELCRGLVETKRAFSAMKHVKTALRNKMEEEFLADSTMIYIERELVEDIDSDSIIDEFYSTKHRRLQLK
ncbi:zinc finger MYM-type protein 1-like isoform X1 [Tripterygium wilfordii]|uniref:zinc finger MYM-type protein 1-like isoform X1 n=1 Tax=Tripterygium wilfordii TaxID=458696 RepID=UPI0018F83194|nr:zinc finger MYM-type protein 1-like isoform X1 [Tripterygium wilfordii]